jgi:hypothetical protein
MVIKGPIGSIVISEELGLINTHGSEFKKTSGSV